MCNSREAKNYLFTLSKFQIFLLSLLPPCPSFSVLSLLKTRNFSLSFSHLSKSNTKIIYFELGLNFYWFWDRIDSWVSSEIKRQSQQNKFGLRFRQFKQLGCVTRFIQTDQSATRLKVVDDPKWPCFGLSKRRRFASLIKKKLIQSIRHCFDILKRLHFGTSPILRWLLVLFMSILLI